VITSQHAGNTNVHQSQEREIPVKRPDQTSATEDSIHSSAVTFLKERGVTLHDLVELVMFLQSDYYPDLTYSECRQNVEKVLAKREVQNAILTGITLDRLAEQRALRQPLQDMVAQDEGLYGIDEILAFGIINVYGSIGFTNYGYIDKVKPGILKKMNGEKKGCVHTFLDDIVGAIAAAASSRLAHSRKTGRDDAIPDDE